MAWLLGAGPRAAPKGCVTMGTCCPCRDCSSAEAKVTVFAYLTPCFNDCGPYGQCSLLRRHGYLYAGCSCKAGECLFLGGFAILPKGKMQFKMLVFKWGSLGSTLAGSVTVPGEGKFWEGPRAAPGVMGNWDEDSLESPKAWRSASEHPQRDQGAWRCLCQSLCLSGRFVVQVPGTRCNRAGLWSLCVSCQEPETQRCPWRRNICVSS